MGQRHRKLTFEEYLHQVYKSYWGTLLAIGLPIAVGNFLLLAWPDLTRGSLTISRILRLTIVCSMGGAAAAAFAYYAIFKPLMRSKGLTYDDLKRENAREKHHSR